MQDALRLLPLALGLGGLSLGLGMLGLSWLVGGHATLSTRQRQPLVGLILLQFGLLGLGLYLGWPFTTPGQQQAQATAHQFMAHLATHELEAAFALLDGTDKANYLPSLREPANRPAAWVLDDFNPASGLATGSATFANGVRQPIALFVEWRATAARWVITGVEFGAADIVKVHFVLYATMISPPFALVLNGYVWLATALDALGLAFFARRWQAHRCAPSTVH